MFVEQSAGRIRCVRMLFVLGGFMPCMGLVTLALWRSSDMHSSTIRRGWEESLGVPLAIESVEHLRPGAIRLHGLDVLAPSGETVLSVHALDVEMSAGEVRLDWSARPVQRPYWQDWPAIGCGIPSDSLGRGLSTWPPSSGPAISRIRMVPIDRNSQRYGGIFWRWLSRVCMPNAFHRMASVQCGCDGNRRRPTRYACGWLAWAVFRGKVEPWLAAPKGSR